MTVYVGGRGYHLAPDPTRAGGAVLWQHDLTPDDRIVPACRLECHRKPQGMAQGMAQSVAWLRAADPVGAFVALARLTREG
jgi:hypothetical protein